MNNEETTETTDTNPWEVGEASNGCVDVRCPSWLVFMSYIDAKHRSSHGRLFRGQRETTWPIDSRLYRETREQLRFRFPQWSENDVSRVAGKIESEEGGNVMQSYASHFAQRDGSPLSSLQSWMTGRHQGLFTPFIDWTRSPYVAAFFGAVGVVENRLETSSREFVVYSISSWLFPFELGQKTSDNAELGRYALKVDAAFNGNPRGIAQQAVATYVYPQTDIATFVREAAATSGVSEKSLERIVLPHSCAEDTLIHLNRMNINYATLFPDSYGLANQANLNLYMPDYEGRGNWSRPPGFELLLPKEEEP